MNDGVTKMSLIRIFSKHNVSGMGTCLRCLKTYEPENKVYSVQTSQTANACVVAQLPLKMATSRTATSLYA